MSSFESIVARIRQPESLTKITAEHVSEIESRDPKLPREYARFLREVGYGDLGGIRLFSGPISPSSIYPSSGELLCDVVLFGDDFQGYCFGFERSAGHRVVEISPGGEIDRTVEGDFLGLIGAYIDT